jgi:hypothetical protein
MVGKVVTAVMELDRPTTVVEVGPVVMRVVEVDRLINAIVSAVKVTLIVRRRQE